MGKSWWFNLERPTSHCPRCEGQYSFDFNIFGFIFYSLILAVVFYVSYLTNPKIGKPIFFFVAVLSLPLSKYLFNIKPVN